MRPSIFPTAFFDSIPEASGVYFFLDEAGTILYIGKAKNLRNRILGHRRSGAEMLPYIHAIRWEIHRSEKAAFARENELLHTVRPPFNIAGTQARHHLYVGWRVSPTESPDFLEAEFVLSGDEIDFTPEFQVYGCFKYRHRTKLAYMALLRLLWAVRFKGRFFAFPADLSRDYPLWHAPLVIRRVDAERLPSFFDGRRLDFLRDLSIDLICNEHIPAFMGPAIQDDLDTLREFFRFGPWTTRKLRRANAFTGHLVPQETMDQWVAGTIDWEEEPVVEISEAAPVTPGLTRKRRRKSEAAPSGPTGSDESSA